MSGTALSGWRLCRKCRRWTACLEPGLITTSFQRSERCCAGELVSEFGDINAPQPEPQRILTTPEHYAYLRIAEGCDNHCAFCIIPQLRGRYRSRPMEELLKEAQDLADERRQGADRHCAGHEPLRHRSVRRAEAGGAAAEALRHRRLCLGACTLSLSGRNV